MSNELRISTTPSSTIYGCIRNSSGQVWYPTGETWEIWGTGSRTANDYAISVTEASRGFYAGDFDSEIAAGTYYVQYYTQAGANPADSDTLIDRAAQEIVWTGVDEAAASVTELGATDICNRALLMIGGGDEQKTITDLYGSDETSTICQILYPLVRKEVMVRWPWNECTKYAELGTALTGSSLPEAAEWDYVFNLPSDCLHVTKQTSQSDHTAEYDFEVKNGKLFTNDLSNDDEDSGFIEYIFNENDASEYSPHLVEAIATKLASELAKPITGDKDGIVTARLRNKYERLVLPVAKGRNQDESYVDDKGESEWLNAR